MAKALHELLYNLGLSETWNLPLQILERDVQALREDVFPIPTIYRKEGVVETEEKKRGAPLIQHRLFPSNPPFPAIYSKIETPYQISTPTIQGKST
ncbi:MAG: hypothetical protein PVJ69_07840 [Desulfobacteraceae bacterium]|jgi:hypothetical protein